MLKSKISIYISAIATIVAIVIGTDQLKAALNSWESAPDIVSMNPDTSYAYTAIGRPTVGQYDRNGDGRIDLIITDRNGDGRPDYWATDRNFDGRFNDYQYDRNFDGRIDQWEYDLDLDGISDKIYVDADLDGKAELYAILNPINRTYTWYGNMSNQQVNAAQHTAFPPLKAPSKKKYKGGKATDSY